MSKVYPTQPIYQVRFSGSSGWLGDRYNFGWYGLSTRWDNYVISISVKPGITTSIGSFEIVIPDTGSSGESFSEIETYNDVYIWLGYDQPDTNPLMRGKIDTIETSFDASSGWIRTISGRDYGEALHRILDRRKYTGSSYSTAVLIKDKAGLDPSNTYIVADSTGSIITLDNSTCFDGEQELADSVSKDFYTDILKKFHWYPRQYTTHSQPILTVGTNIFNYRVISDITESKNQLYVFGPIVDNPVSGSYWPKDYDSWTENDTTGWTCFVKSGSAGWESLTVNANDILGHTTGSKAIWAGSEINAAYQDFQFILTKTLPRRLCLNSGNTLHFWHGTEADFVGGSEPFEQRIRLITSTNNYFECQLESIDNRWFADTYRPERTISLGSTQEGLSITGSKNTITGSYSWSRFGNPDWYNINSIELYQSSSNSFGPIDIIIDGLYIITEFQWTTGSTGSQQRYGLREGILHDRKWNSAEYCQNVASVKLAELSGSITQIELVTTGSPGLQIGDLYHLYIPSVGITSGAYYDLIELEHIYNSDGFTTKCTFSDRKEVRIPIPVFNYPIQRTYERKTISTYGFKPHTVYWSPFS